MNPLPILTTIQREALEADILAHGIRQPIEVDATTGEILDGWHRKEIAEAHGLSCPQVEVADLDTDEERAAYSLRVNLTRRQLSREQERDVLDELRHLARHFRDQNMEQADIGVLVGRSQPTISKWLADDDEDISDIHVNTVNTATKIKQDEYPQIMDRLEAGETQEQVAADYGVDQSRIAQIKKSVEKTAAEQADREQRIKEQADLVKQSRKLVQVDQADALEWLPQQEPCDLLLTDPPYSTDLDDVAAFAASWLPLSLSRVKPSGSALVFIGAYPEELHAYLSVKMPTQVLVWHYKNTQGAWPKERFSLDWQAVLYYRGPSAPPVNQDTKAWLRTVQQVNAPDARQAARYHSWQKPVELLRRLVSVTTIPGDLILDPFAGSGSGAIAAMDLKRRWLGCDLDPEAVSITRKRIKEWAPSGSG